MLDANVGFRDSGNLRFKVDAGHSESGAVFVAALAASKTVKLDSAEKLDTARLAFTTSWLFASAVIVYLYFQIRRLGHTASALQTADSSPAGSPTKRITRRQTSQAAELAAAAKHDRLQLRALLKDQAKSLLIVLLLHAYLGRPGPLFLQTALPPWRVLRSNLFKVHVLGRAPIGALQRPWQDNRFMTRTKKTALTVVKAKVANLWKKNKAA